MYTNSMNIKLAFALMFILIVLPMFSAQTTLTTEQNLGVFKQNSIINLTQYCSNATQGVIEYVVLPDSTPYNVNAIMVRSGNMFSYGFNNSNQLGDYAVYGNCNGVSWQYGFQITPNGENNSIQTSIIQVFLILFFISLIFVFYYLNRNIDYNKWYNSILTKYQTRNFVKVAISSIFFNIMKNNFIIYYLLGLPIIINLTEIAYSYNLLGILAILKSFLIIYLVGILLLGILFLSYVQEWIVDLINDIRDMGWGIQK